MNYKKLFLFICVFVLWMTTALISAEDVSVRVRVDPVNLPVGQYGFYQVEVKGATNVDVPKIPKINGVDLQYVGPQRSIINNNGNVQSKITFAFRVLVRDVRDYMIPQYTIRVGQQEYTVPAVEMHGVAAVHAQQGQTISGHFLQGDSYDSEDIEPYLEIEVPSDYIYVGEAVPCKIKLYCPNGTIVMPRGLSFPAHDVFTATTLRNPSESNVKGKNGESLMEYSWTTVLTPIKEGQFTLGFTLNAVVSNPLKTAMGEMLFSRWPSMVQHMLSSEEMQLSTPEVKVSVVGFPKENQPVNFTGAIGQFTLHELGTPASVVVGEPITLTLDLEGVGNFERIQAIELNFPKDQWRVYPPKVSFDGKDELGLIGSKRFEYIVVPQTTAIKEIPEICFPFFNHTVDAYHEIKLAARPIEVKPSAQHAEVSQFAAQSAGQEDSVEEKVENLKSQKNDGVTFNLIANKIHPGVASSDRVPFYRNYLLMITQIVLIVLLIVFVRRGVIYRKGRLNPGWLTMLRLNKEIIELEGVLQKAYKKGDAAQYWMTFDRMMYLQLRRILGENEEVSVSSEKMIAFIQEKAGGVLDDKEWAVIFERIEKLKFAGGLTGGEAQVTQKMYDAIQLVLSRLQKVVL